MINGDVKTFRLTSIRLFYIDTSSEETSSSLKEKLPDITPVYESISNTPPKPGRLIVEILIIKPIKGLPVINDDYDTKVFLTKKETRDKELLAKLRAKSKIITPGL